MINILLCQANQFAGQTLGYPAQSGYPTPAQQQSRYPTSQGSYPGARPGYPVTQQAYAGGQPGYPPTPQPAAQPPAGYPAGPQTQTYGATPGYPSGQPGYPGAQPGYPTAPGYPQQPQRKLDPEHMPSPVSNIFF